MKISKFVQTIKSTGQCVVIHAPGEIYLSNRKAIYTAPEIPDITGTSQIAAVLDIEPKKLKKIVVHEEHCKDKANILGVDFNEYTPDELEVSKMNVAAVVGENIYAAFLCRNNGEMIFFDESLLAPIKDRIKKEDAYIDYTARIHPKGYKYIIVKDDIEVLAAARIWLEIKDVNIQRLQEMTLDDFLSEGVLIHPEAYNDPYNAYMHARRIFTSIWDSTILPQDKDKYGWAANPWVWVYDFKRRKGPEVQVK